MIGIRWKHIAVAFGFLAALLLLLAVGGAI